MLSSQRRIQKFFQGGGIQIRHIFKRSFFGRIILKHIENKKGSRGGGGGMLPRKVSENLLTVLAILALFEQFSGKFCVKFFASNSACFTKYDAFCSCIFDYACLGRKAYCYRKGSKLWKNCIDGQ